MPAASQLPHDLIRVVFYEHKGDNDPSHWDTSWEQLVSVLSDHEASPCTVAPGASKCVGKLCKWKSASSLPWQDGRPNPMAWSLVEIVGKRNNANVRSVTLLVLDYDHLDLPTWHRVRERFQPWEHVWHTTHNHRGNLRAEAPEPGLDACLRFVVRLSRRVGAGEYRRFRAAALEYLGVIVNDRNGDIQPDRSCKDLSRPYFRPSHPKDITPDFGHNQGASLDVDAVLAWARENIVEPPPSPFDSDDRGVPEASEWDLDSEAIEAAIELMADNFPPRRRNDFCMALAGMLRRAGATEETAEYIVKEIAERGGSNEPEKRAKTVRHTYALDPDGEMTGYTRVIEILEEHNERELAEQVASDFGGFITDAANDAFLRNIVSIGAAPRSHEARVAQDVARALEAPPVVSMADLRDKISAVAGSRARSYKRDDKVDALLLRRVLTGKQLALPGGIGDPETRYESEQGGVTPEKAMSKVAGMIAFAVPFNTPWGAVAEILRPCLATIPDGMERTQALYTRAMGRRAEAEVKRAREDDERRERNVAALLPQSATAAALAPPPPPARVPPPPPTTIAPPPPPAAPPPPPAAGFASPQVPVYVASSTPASSGPPDGEDWADDLVKGKDGTITGALHNATLIFRNDEVLRGAFAWNEHDKRLEARGYFARFNERGPEAVITQVQDYISARWGVSFGFPDLKRRVLNSAFENAYDPLADWLRGCGARWDGVNRIDTFLIRYLGVEDTPHYRRISRRWLIGAVARGLEPGCKFENVLILEHRQGARKTSAFEALGGRFYDSAELDITNKDSQMLASSTWLQEMGELHSLKRSESTQQKAWFSRRVDKFRPPFAAALIDTPRRIVPVGSTNDDLYSSDHTGFRRGWTCRCGDIDLPALLRDAEQIWGEAVRVYLAHTTCPDCAASDDTVYGQKARCAAHRWWLRKEEEAESMEISERRMEDQPWMAWREKILRWWRETPPAQRPTAITATVIALDVGELRIDAVNRGVLTQIGYAMSKIGFIRNAATRTYVPSVELLAEKHIQSRLFVLPGGKTTV